MSNTETEQEQALCWYCDGTGETVMSTIEVVGKTIRFVKYCRTCKGTGLVPASQEVPASGVPG